MLFFSSCSDTYREFQSIRDMKWEKKDVKKFEVNITEEGEYDLFFAMRHSAGYPFTSIKVNILQNTPDGKNFSKQAEFPVADENGKYLGDVTGQLWDIESTFAEKMFMKRGKYTFKISHSMNSNPVILVVDVGLIIRKYKVNK